jgi:hypothetical protein
MQLNEKITDKLTELHEQGVLTKDEIEFSKLVLFLATQNILITDVIEYINWEKLLNKLLYNGLLGRDYTKTNHVSPTYPLVTFQQADCTEPKDDLDDFVDEFRALWSKDNKGTLGLKPGVLGDRSYLKKKLKAWFKEYKSYSKEDVLNTARYYIAQQAESDYKYLQSCDYFVYKDGRSRLASLVEIGKDKDSQIEQPGSTAWNKRLGNQ